MSSIIYRQVQEIINQLSEARLAEAYTLLVDLQDRDANPVSPQQQAMHLSLDERRRLMAQQAEVIASHYLEPSAERDEWQAGDFVYAD
jgi:hypothetical protein